MKTLLTVFSVFFVAGISRANPPDAVAFVKVPSAEALSSKQFLLQTLLASTPTQSSSDRPLPPGCAVRTQYGLWGNSEVGLEAGLEWSEYLYGENEKLMRMHVKASIREGEYRPAVSLGIMDFGFRTDVGNYDIVYGTIGKSSRKWGGPTIGVYFGNPSLLRDENQSIANKGILFGYRRQMPEIHARLEIVLDWMSGYHSLAALNIGPRIEFNESAHVGLFYSTANNRRLVKDTILVKTDVGF